jgi:hypothetical protein
MNRSALAALLLAAGCLQVIDPDAASGGGENDGPTISIDTPPIELPDGGSTAEACVLTTQQANDILSRNCAACHGGGSPGASQGQPPFDFVLDFDRLKTTRSASVPDPSDPAQGMLFIAPGAPELSRVYMRIWNREMPPEPPVGLPPIPMPTVSDMSLLDAWIATCM